MAERLGSKGLKFASLELCVVASFVLTACASFAVWKSGVYSTADSYLRVINGKSQAAEVESQAEILVGMITAMDEKQLRVLAHDIAEKGPPEFLSALGTEFIAKYASEKAHRFAVYIAEAGSAIWQHPSLLIRTGTEYRRGRFVERDYAKAFLFLSDPLIIGNPAYHLQLGEYYLDAENPSHDFALGVTYVENAAMAGDAAAQRRLAGIQRRLHEDKQSK